MAGECARIMLRRCLLLLLVSLFTRHAVPACAAALPAEAESLSEDIAQLRKLAGRSSRWRADSARAYGEISPRLKEGVLTSGDMARLYAGAEAYVRQRRRWQALMDCQGDEAWERPKPRLALNPPERLQAKLVLAAALAQHDDYRQGVHPWFCDGKSRRLLKTDRPEVEGELDSAVRHFLNPVMRLRLARAVVWHRAEGVKLSGRTADEAFLDEMIVNSPGYAFFTRNLGARALEEWKTGGHAAVTFVTDHVANFGDMAAASASRVVGNTVGLVETRSGWLASLPESERRRIEGGLRPLDVLLEKTPFRLTDKSIPGHYGHVAVWVGTEAELKELGVWEDPLVRPHHARLRAGAGVVEALRPGVEINTLGHFLNIDDLLVIRSAPLSKDEVRAGVLRAFAQVGKEYDFNFNVESDRRIVCSELAFVVFPGVSWPTSAVLGRQSITPDQVAVKASPGAPFRPVMMWHDGVEVREKLSESLACLLKEDTEGFRRLHPGFSGKSDSAR